MSWLKDNEDYFLAIGELITKILTEVAEDELYDRRNEMNAYWEDNIDWSL